MAAVLEKSSMLTKWLLPALLLMAACKPATSEKEGPEAAESTESTRSAENEVAVSEPLQEKFGPQIDVWSDPKATYTDEGGGPLPNGHLWLTTRRDGPSGVSFAKREIDCSNHTFRYLQEGDTLTSMSDSASAEMTPLTEGSISTLVSEYACRKYGR